MSDFFLNQEQQQAVKYNKGPLLIIAGAGTGKTSVIVEKIKYLVKKKLARPEQILALTFTEKAASEMEERVDQAMPYGYFQMSISTFHAFADQILKENGHQIGISPGYQLMTEAETIIFLKQNLFLFNLKYFRPLGNPNKFLEALLQHFSRLRDEDISPEDYLKWVKNNSRHSGDERGEESRIETEKYLELAQAYETYQKLKTKESLMDFADLVYYLLQLFRQRPNILKRYQQQFSFILVDEFQDTNISQYQLIKLLCPAKKNPHLSLVCDDSQAIYKFRGASVSNIITFMKDYKKAKQITLKKNYRSNQTILDNAYRLIKNNDPDTLEVQLGISKNLIANKPDDKGALNFYLAEKVEEESEFIVKKILELKDNYRFSDFAILVRANNHSEPFIKALARSGIPYQFLGPGMLYKQPEVKDLIAYLKVLYNLEDSPSLFRVLYMNIYSIDKKDVSLLLSFSRKINQPLFQAIEIYLSFFDVPDSAKASTGKSIHRNEFDIYKLYLPLLKFETKKQLLKIYQMIIKHLSLLKINTAGQILYYFLEDSGLLLKLTNYKTESEEKIALNISNFFNKLKSFESEHEDASVFAVIDYINMSMELGESPIVSKTDISSFNAVNILTVHSAKGLEFPIVFLVNLTEERFPTRHKKETISIPQELIKEILPTGDYHIEEERRLFYVGLTRAKDKVFLSASKFYGEGKRQRKISRFVIETLGEELVNKFTTIKKEEKSQLSIFDFKTNKLINQSLTTNYQLLLLKKFSFSQLNSFKTCPLQYKYQYILKIPTIPTAAESFGITIHQTLQKFYSEFLKNKKMNEKDLLIIYKKTWIPIGYASLAHQNRMKKEGEKMLVNFYKKFHSSNLKIIALEKLFKIKIANDVYLTGKIDRIDSLNKNEIEIIDYKTGKKPSEHELTKSLQLTIYALAANDKNLFNKKLGDINLTFYYLQMPEKISLKRNEENLIKTKEEIINMVAEIRKNEFPANPGKHCDFCSFKIICEAWQ
ncbi:MAG: ATP-dependent DNA helicase [Candidatus Roizmanbacteria bacterium]|nr:ATP-dependent DNA helicase [Candidatus Roizmanbacteria bacterium]